MLKLGELELGNGRPAVAVSFTDIDGRHEVTEAREAGVAIAELRIDLFARLTPDYVIRQAERLSGLPTIATIRHEDEGGGWRGDEAVRIELFKAVLPYVDAIDVELAKSYAASVLAPLVKAAGKLLILSHHDFASTPTFEVLADVCRRAVAAGADIVKIAAMVQDDGDVATLARLLEERPAPNLIIIGMGDKGVPTRAAFPARGSLLTFAAKGERISAPGQIAYKHLLAVLAELQADSETS